jgi:hypothetical protein
LTSVNVNAKRRGRRSFLCWRAKSATAPCTARYNFDGKEANKIDCAVLASDIGRPWLTERYRTAPILGATLHGAHLPVFGS